MTFSKADLIFDLLSLGEFQQLACVHQQLCTSQDPCQRVGDIPDGLDYEIRWIRSLDDQRF
jgi:hypothetical protein